MTVVVRFQATHTTLSAMIIQQRILLKRNTEREIITININRKPVGIFKDSLISKLNYLCIKIKQLLYNYFISDF